MDSNNQYQTPLNKQRIDSSSLRATAIKRDSLVAELERDPQLSSAKRQQRTQAFSTSVSQASLERQLLAAQTAKAEADTKLREKELLVERLERDRRYFADREKEEREEKEREREVNEDVKRKSDAENRALRASVTALREELADLQDTHQSLSRNTSHTIATQKSQITTLSHQTEVLQGELDGYKQITQEREAMIQDLQTQCEELSARQETAVQRASDDENMTIVREELHRQASYVRNLESANYKLTAEVNRMRERQTSVEVLREEKRGLEQRILHLEELRTKVVQLEAEVDAARKEREEWASRPSEDSAGLVQQTLSNLRLAHARLLEENGATAALLRQCEARLKTYEQKEPQMLEQITAMEKQHRELKDKILRRETRASLAEHEVTFLKALVASYNAEAADDIKIDTTNVERINQLETLLEEYKVTNVHLSQELDTLGGTQSVSAKQDREALLAELEMERLEKAALKKELEDFEEELKQNADKIEELEQTLFELRGEIAGGRHVPPKTKVLQLVDNPEKQWFDLRQAAMDRLKGENEALLKRLKELEESGARVSSEGNHGEDLVPRASWDLVNQEKEELVETVRQREKRLLRLQEIFKAKTAEFRGAIASILGLKLAFYPNGQVRVTSVFDLNTSFIFQPASSSEGGRMQLIGQGEGGPEDLPSLMEYWLHREQCPAGFIATITLESYEKAKRENDSNDQSMM